MNLLIVAQVVDKDHAVLGFFHDWIAALAPRFTRIEIICLFEGSHKLPPNVHVRSLGKDRGNQSRLIYALRFLKLAWSLRRKYDAVFVHMNEEYLLLAGIMWRVLGKRAYLWRNHYAGSLRTDLAAAFATKIFCTSRYSYTAKYKKTVLMPVGVDLQRFSKGGSLARNERSILFLARMSPAKDPIVLVEALRLLNEKGISFTATFAGSPLPSDEAFYRSIVNRAEHYGLVENVTFTPGVPNHETPRLYDTHGIFVNCSPSGMFDKTMFEAAASGSLVLARSQDWQSLAPAECHFDGKASDLAQSLELLLALSDEKREHLQRQMQNIASSQSLSILMKKLTDELY